MLIQFAKPYLLLLLIPSLYLIIRWYRKSFADLSPIRRRISLVSRILVVLLLCLALAGLRWLWYSQNLSVLYLVDLSQSVQTQTREFAKSVIRESSKYMKPTDSAGVIAFGENALVEISPQAKPDLDKFTTQPNTHFTDISKSLQLAMAIFPKENAKRVVLITDGNENSGNSLDQAIMAKGNGIEINIIPVGGGELNEISIDNLIVPGKSQFGEPVEIKAIVNSNINTKATLRLFRNQTYIASKEVNLSIGKNLVSFLDERKETGITRYEVLVEPENDTFVENNIAYGYTVVAGEPKVLLVTDNPRDSQYIYSSLQSENIKTEMGNNQQIPFNISDLVKYDVCILDNVSALQLNSSQMKVIQTYVRDMGGGFVMIGGEESFGPGGYYKTPVEETLPVDMDLKSKKYLPSMVLILVIDKSGSMGEINNNVQKIDMAKESALATLGLLRPDDKVGIIAFDYASKWVVEPINANNVKTIKDNVATLRAGGGTDLYPALVEAENKLMNMDAKLKHIIILSDGRSQPGDFEGIVKKLGTEKITVSTVAIGLDADIPMMEMLANTGKGRFYQADDIMNLPRIFTKETIIASRSYVIEEPFIPVESRETPIFRGLDMTKMPLLLGYVATSPKPRAEVILVSHKKDPIFAQWQYGLGKSIAFTSDAKPRWAADWIRWPGFNKFWSQSIRWILKSGSSGLLHPQIEILQGKGRVVVDALDDKNQFVNFLEIEAQVVAPNLETQSIQLNQVSAGRYEGWFDAKETGTYVANLSAKEPNGTTVLDHQLTGGSMAYSPEFKQLGINVQLLEKLASVTGGKFITDPKEIFLHNLVARQEPQDASQWLLLLALFLFTLDIFVRRLVLSKEQFAPVFLYINKIKNTVRWKQKEKPPLSPEPVYIRLKERKAEVQVERGLHQESKESSEFRVQSSELNKTFLDNMNQPSVQSKPESSDSTLVSDMKQEPESGSHLSRLLDAKKRAKNIDKKEDGVE